MYVTPNISLIVWDQVADPYDYLELATNFARLDEHDHTPGKGKVIPSSGIADGAITNGKLAANSVQSGNIVDGTIVTADLADNSVTSAKIVNGTIATADIADGAITSAKILDGTIVNADVNASAAIAYSKLALSSSILSSDLATTAKANFYSDTVPGGQVFTGGAAQAVVTNLQIDVTPSVAVHYAIYASLPFVWNTSPASIGAGAQIQLDGSPVGAYGAQQADSGFNNASYLNPIAMGQMTAAAHSFTVKAYSIAANITLQSGGHMYLLTFPQ